MIDGVLEPPSRKFKKLVLPAIATPYENNNNPAPRHHLHSSAYARNTQEPVHQSSFEHPPPPPAFGNGSGGAPQPSEAATGSPVEWHNFYNMRRLIWGTTGPDNNPVHPANYPNSVWSEQDSDGGWGLNNNTSKKNDKLQKDREVAYDMIGPNTVESVQKINQQFLKKIDDGDDEHEQKCLMCVGKTVQYLRFADLPIDIRTVLEKTNYSDPISVEQNLRNLALKRANFLSWRVENEYSKILNTIKSKTMSFNNFKRKLGLGRT